MNKSVMNSDIFLKFHGFYTRMYSSHYWISKIKFKTLGELYIVMKKNSRNTKGKIVSAAWKLFYQQGYDNTTIEEIVEASGTSRGSFYHYFEGKDALLSSLSYLFDDKYVELEKTMDPALSPIEKLKYINHLLIHLKALINYNPNLYKLLKLQSLFFSHAKVFLLKVILKFLQYF